MLIIYGSVSLVSHYFSQNKDIRSSAASHNMGHLPVPRTFCRSFLQVGSRQSRHGDIEYVCLWVEAALLQIRRQLCLDFLVPESETTITQLPPLCHRQARFTRKSQQQNCFIQQTVTLINNAGFCNNCQYISSKSRSSLVK